MFRGDDGKSVATLALPLQTHIHTRRPATFSLTACGSRGALLKGGNIKAGENAGPTEQEGRSMVTWLSKDKMIKGRREGRREQGAN